MNSGHFSLLLLVMAVLSVVFVVYLTHRMDVIDHESYPLHLLGQKLPVYYLWLVGKIVISNFAVVRLIWQVRPDISPCVRWIPLSQVSDIGKVIYANSITLTPGTVAMDIHDNQIFVHALTHAGIEELLDGELDRRAAELER
jgi:multicomponent Na+:H+ antiporter subunit E